MPNPPKPIVAVHTPSARLSDLLQSRSGDDLSSGNMPKKEKGENGRERGRRIKKNRKKKKKLNQNSKSVCSSSFPNPYPSLIVPVLSRFDFSKATTSLSFFLSHLSRSGVCPTVVLFFLPVLGLCQAVCKSMGALLFSSEPFTQTIVLSGRIFY